MRKENLRFTAIQPPVKWKQPATDQNATTHPEEPFTDGEWYTVHLQETPGEFTDSFRDLEGSTSVFDDAALYEPGYTQVVYFEVTNEGNVPFDYKVETTVASQRAAENVLGDTFTLQPYLRYAVTYTPETDTVSREKTRLLQNVDLYHLDQLAPFAPESLAPGQKDYVAIVVHMPESVGNEANYRGDTIPEIILGIRVTAVQTGLSETDKAEALAAEMTN